MFDISEILNYRSVAIVGLEKNTGKTECLNYLLRKLDTDSRHMALTSVGVDGESCDQVCQTSKPEIEVPEGMVFVTSEKHYREKRLVAEVLEISEERTALGRMVTARAKTTGKVLLSGPSHTVGLKLLLNRLARQGVKTTLVDGALSRLSLASPVVTEAMILASGAAVSGNIPELVRKTRYVYDLIVSEEVDKNWQERLDRLEKGVWAVDDKGEVWDLGLPSVFMLEKQGENLFRYGRRLYVAGAVTDRLFHFLGAQKQTVELIIRDFTRVFASAEAYYAFLRKGSSVKVVHRSRLLAVTVNPQSPGGILLDSERLCSAMQESLGIPVYDVKRME